VDRQGEGFHTDGFVNQYFEARFLSGASPSLWPAFWTLSANNYAGAVGPCDELDIIEGYMAWPDGYSIASHGWGDHPQPDIAGGKSVRTEELYGQQGNITMGFHTYGMLITEDYTYYYFDNDLVLTAPTLLYSWREGNYFMINNAMSDHSFPEGYGFERYGDASHMYIDWVRVYQQPADPDAVRFISDIRVREVKPGDTLSVAISRSEGAQAISGAYDVALPAGWTLLSGAAFAAGQAEDTLVFKVDENYTAYSAQIAITPVGSDGTRYRPVLIDTRADTPFFIEIYPSFETGGADGGEWAANVRLVNGFEAGTLAGGYIDVAAPAEAAGRYAFGSIPAGQSATVKLPGGDLKLLELTEYSINVVREDGYERKASKLLSSLTAARNDPQAPVVIDGAFTEAEWAGAMPVDLGAGQATNYGASRPWGGENDISAKGRLKWDDEYLYFGVSVKDDIHFEEADTISSWGSDSLQFSMDPGRIAGYAGDHPRFIAAVNSATGAYGLEAESWGQLPGSPTAGALMRGARHEDTKTTDYEIALRWASILPSGSLPAGAGSSAALDLGFSFLVNDNDADANGRVGWMSYMGGIGIGKNAAEFGDLLLSDLAALPDGAGGTGPGPDPEPGDKSALGLMVDNLGGIYTGIFTEESAGAYADALDGANDVLELEGATQEAIDDAAVALAEAFDGLALADEYSAYGELVELLLGVARLDGREYTEASWKNLQTVAADAWAFIELATGGAQSAEASGAEAFGAGAFGALGEGAGEGDELSVLADISADIAKWLVAVQEALAALEAAGSGEPAGPGAKMFAGIHADAAAAELAEEEIAQSGMPAVGFTLKGDGIAGAGTVNVRLSFRTADIEDGGVEFSLPGSIAAKAKLSATNVVDLVPPQEPLIGGYTTYSVYILANGSETFDADGGAALLNIALKPKAANQAAVSLILSHLDIAYTESGGEAAIADTGIDASVATTALRVYSRFDINRDGAVTLVDVDIVRASLGKRRADDGTWESERAARCDFDGNGVIEIADLTCAIAKYEATVL
jgi:hypothetical protein